MYIIKIKIFFEPENVLRCYGVLKRLDSGVKLFVITFVVLVVSE
jgi:hypothetical protein